MSLDVYLQEDVARALVALGMAGGGTAALVGEELERAAREDRPPDNEVLADHLRVYRQGYNDALAALGAAFGVMPGMVELVQLGAG